MTKKKTSKKTAKKTAKKTVKKVSPPIQMWVIRDTACDFMRSEREDQRLMQSRRRRAQSLDESEQPF